VLFNDSASNFVVAAQGTVIPSTVTFNNSISNYTVSGIIGGSATLSKSGSASLTLSGSSSYSGVTTISAGTVVAGNGNALGAKTAGTTISGTGALEINGQNLGAEEITISGTGFGGNGTIVNSGVDQINALQKVVLGGNASIGGTKRWDLRGTGNYLDMNGFTLTKVGSNYIALVGTLLTNTPGNIVIQSGTLGIQTTADLLGSSANTVTVQTGAALENYQTTALQYWSLVMQDGSTFWAENGSGLQNTWAGPVTLNGGATLRADGVMTISGDISGSGSVTKTGGSVATLSSFNNTYNGPTTINGGRLAIDGILTTSPVVVNSGGTLSGYGTINSTVTVTNNGKIVPGNVGAALVSGIGTLTVGSLTLHVGATADFEITDSVLLDQVTVSTSGGLTLNGGGINLYNPGTNSAFAVNGTYPLFNYSGALNGSVSNLTVLNPVVGKTYAFSATGSQVQVTIGDGPAPIFWGVNLDGSWATPGNWAPNTVPNGQFVTANFGGTNNPVITGPRTVTLDGSYTVGSLVFSNAQPFTVNQGSGGTIQLDNGAGVPVISQLGGSHTINAPLALPVQGASVTVASATTLSLNGAVSGTGGLTKAGTGTNVLAGANSYSGATLVNAGTLVVSNNTALGSTAGATILNTGAANNTATVVLANGVTVTGETITINGYGQNVRGSLQAGNGATAEWAGPVSLGNGVVGDGNRIGAQANGTLKISGPITNGTIPDLYISADGNTGTVIVSGANTYSGQSAIIRGTLKLGANNSLPVGSLLNVHSASGVSDRAVFDLAGYNQQVAGVVRGNTSGPALVTNSSPTLATLTVSNTLGYAFDSLIGGNLSFVKTGSGSQTNSAANTYTGNTTVNAGTLVIAQATLNTNSTVSIATNAVLRLNFSTTNLVAALVLNGINQPAGVYNSVNAASYIAGTGSLQVPSLVVPPPSTGTNITYTVSAGQITLTWPSNYTGWYLQSQTNGLNAGLSNNWVTVSGSQNTNQVTLPVAGTNPAVFFRMVYTNAP
jgi:autotransporter-associated beta strand protein